MAAHGAGQLFIGAGDGTGVLKATNYRLYDAAVSAPTTVGNYLELFSVPNGTLVWLLMQNPGGQFWKAYQFPATSAVTGVVDVPPCAGRDHSPTSNTVVLEHWWDSTNSRVVIRLRRQAGTTTFGLRVLAITSQPYTPLSGTGSSTNDNTLHPFADRGWEQKHWAILSSNVTSVSVANLRATRAGGGKIYIAFRGGTPVSPSTGCHLRINGEADGSAWTTQHMNVDGSTFSGARVAGDAQICMNQGSWCG